jgi:hypothetical protein
MTTATPTTPALPNFPVPVPPTLAVSTLPTEKGEKGGGGPTDTIQAFIREAFKLSKWNALTPTLHVLDLVRTMEALVIPSEVTLHLLRTRLPLFTLLFLVDRYYPDEGFARAHAHVSDGACRTAMLDKLHLSHLVEGAEKWGDLKIMGLLRTQLWKDFMSAAKGGAKFELPAVVHQNIANKLVRDKCHLEMTFLSNTHQDILQQVLRDLNLPNEQPLNMKQDLCRTIQALNDLSREETRDTIHACLTRLRDHGEAHMTDAAFHTETETVQKFMRAVDNWDKAESYYMDTYGFCANGTTNSCLTSVARLHATARAVKRYADKCKHLRFNRNVTDATN